jgi:hypothetical protein
MKVPTLGTDVFAIGQGDGTASIPDYVSGFPVGAAITKRTSSGNNGRFSSRLTGKTYLSPNLTQIESADTAAAFDFQNGWGSDGTNRNTDEYAWMFQRAPGFFDEVCYTGTGGGSQQVNHNLGVSPELALIKRRSATGDWEGYSTDKVNIYNGLNLNLTNAANSTNSWSTYSPYFTSTFIDVAVISNSPNASGSTYVAYLFATCAGVSKVGSYTGNGTTQTINCGFTGGARFVLIKRTDSTGDWMVSDSTRGIIAGNDPYLELNNTNAEVTGEDWLDTNSTGFVVNEVSGSNANTSSATYIFLAIA